MRRRDNLKLTWPSWRRAVLAGAGASTAYLLEMAIDMRLTGNRYDDLLLWGGLVPGNDRRQKLVGLLGHYSMGTGVAVAYEMLGPSLPQLPGWLRGLIFGQMEHVLLFGGGNAVLDAIHPAVRSGRLPRLLCWQYFWLATIRHAAYGLVLGLLEKDVKRG